MKVAAEGLPIFTFRTISALGSGVVLLIIARLSGHSLSIPRRVWPGLCVSAFLNITVWLLCSAYALTLIPSGHAGVIAYTMPLWAFIIAIPVLGEKPLLRQWLALVLGLTAVGVLAARGWQELGAVPWGAAVMVFGAASWAAGTVSIKKINWRTPLIVVTGWQFVVGGIPMALVMSGDVGKLYWPPIDVVLATAYSTLIALAFGFWIWFRVVDMVPATMATLSTLAIPGLSILAGALMLGETIGSAEIIALALIVAALVTVQGRASKHAA